MVGLVRLAHNLFVQELTFVAVMEHVLVLTLATALMGTLDQLASFKPVPHELTVIKVLEMETVLGLKLALAIQAINPPTVRPYAN
jgi:hypothetical protein